MGKIFKIVDRIATIIAWIGVALIAIMMVMYTIDVVGRLLISRQMKGTFEIAQFMLCIITFSSYGYTQIKRGHIHVGFITGSFPPKAKYVTAAISFILCTAMCCISTYSLWRLALFSLSSKKSTTVLEMPFAPIYFVSAVFMALFALTVLMDVFRSFMAIGGNPRAKESIDRVYL